MCIKFMNLSTISFSEFEIRSLPFEKRVDQVLSWLDLPKEKRPSFLTLYMEQPDKSGHSASPKSIKVRFSCIT